MKTTVLVFGMALLAAVSEPSSASGEWPRFRGPDGSGIAAADAKPATAWSTTSHLKWRAALPGPGGPGGQGGPGGEARPQRPASE